MPPVKRQWRAWRRRSQRPPMEWDGDFVAGLRRKPQPDSPHSSPSRCISQENEHRAGLGHVTSGSAAMPPARCFARRPARCHHSTTLASRPAPWRNSGTARAADGVTPAAVTQEAQRAGTWRGGGLWRARQGSGLLAGAAGKGRRCC